MKNQVSPRLRSHARVAGSLCLWLALCAGAAPHAPAMDDGGAAPSGWVERAGSVVGEAFAPGTHRFFADEQARRAAFASYALVEEPQTTPLPAETRVKPVFGVHEGRQAVKIIIEPGTSLYGTGEVAGPLLRNGRVIETWNTDAYGYGDEAKSLYQAHPWVLAVRADGTSYGVLADTTYRCLVDTGYSNPGEILFAAHGPAFPVIVIERDSPQEVLKELARLTGHMPMPPKWAVGYHQCRYSYFPEARVREIAREFRERQIPCDVIWLDIDYMEGFRVFTFDRGHFPDPRKLNEDLLAKGFHNVWMIDPGLKSRDDRSPNDPPQEVRDAEPAELKAKREEEIARYRAIRDSGTANDVWVKRAEGSVYEGEVWPGWCYFPDYTDPGVRAWWADLYEDFMSYGISGVWNDMNEPAVFNVVSKTMPEDNLHRGDPGMVTPTGEAQGARAAGDHARYHNVYGMQMIRGTREGIARVNPQKRPFVLSRANFIGGQRYGATWTGDNTANWYHLEVSIPMSLNVGLSGQPFIGPDVGGFAGNGDGDLFARWMGFGALLPFSRGHTGKENIDKEPWSFGPGVEATSKAALETRYILLPHIYTLFREASVNGMPVARPLFFADTKDAALRSEDDSFLLGDGLLVEAQVVPDRTRVPVKPRGIWRRWRDLADPDLPALFVKGGAIIPTGPIVQYVGEKPLDPLTLVVSLDAQGKATGELYEDEGDGFGYRAGEYLLSTYTAEQVGDEVVVTLSGEEGSMPRPSRGLRVHLLVSGPGGATRTVEAIGKDGGAVRVKLD